MSVLDRLVASSLPFVPKPLVGYFARPYIAGETLDDQARVVRSLNDEGFMAATGILGEFVERREEAESAVVDYQDALLRIEQDKLASNVHVKLTLLGLKIDKEFCYQNIRRLVAFAREHSNFVRIDMEDSSCTDDTLEIFLRLRKEFDNVGAVIHAYLKRSLDDARKLAQVKANVRVCKGIYIEPPDIAFRDREQVRSSFVSLLEELLGKSGAVLRLTVKGLRELSLVGFAQALRRSEEIYRRELLPTEDVEEGVQAFLAKRKPRWSHK